MSSSGIYTREINKNPGWRDGGDTMVYHVFIKGENLGYFQVERNHDNTWSNCVFFAASDDRHLSRKIFEYKGKKAIQTILRMVCGDMNRIITQLQTVLL